MDAKHLKLSLGDLDFLRKNVYSAIYEYSYNFHIEDILKKIDEQIKRVIKSQAENRISIKDLEKENEEFDEELKRLRRISEDIVCQDIGYEGDKNEIKRYRNKKEF